MTSTKVFCFQCVHFERRYSDHDRCVRPLTDQRDPVRGKIAQRVLKPCFKERRSHQTLVTRRERCGPDARFFKAMPTE